MVKNSLANAGDVGLIPGLGRTPAKEMATPSSVIAWKSPWTESSVHGVLQELDMTSQPKNSNTTMICINIQGSAVLFPKMEYQCIFLHICMMKISPDH